MATHALSVGVSERSPFFRSRYEVEDFEFSHKLTEDPVFALNSIQILLGRHLDQPANCYWSSGAVRVHDPWTAGTQNRLPLLETFSAIATSNSLIILKNIECDSVLGPVVRQIMDELLERVGARLRDDIVRPRATLLIASPRRMTSYHMDGDTNFLFQIRGRKRFNVVSKFDRSVLPESELESYFSGDVNAAVFKQSRLHGVRQYLLVPGSAIHIPSTAPHWACTLDDVSVALSINFDLRSIERRARLYRINARLRRLGLKPTPPGSSAYGDAMKLAAHGVVRTFRTLAVLQRRVMVPQRTVL